MTDFSFLNLKIGFFFFAAFSLAVSSSIIFNSLVSILNLEKKGVFQNSILEIAYCSKELSMTPN